MYNVMMVRIDLNGRYLSNSRFIMNKKKIKSDFVLLNDQPKNIMMLYDENETWDVFLWFCIAWLALKSERVRR